jgi:hypothetical protein
VVKMNEIPNLILQSKLPEGQTEVATARLPSMRPVVGPWLTCDDAYDAQMVLRRKLLHDCEADVYAQTPSGLAAACGFVDAVLDALPDGFVRTEDHVQCPDGYKVLIDWLAPLRSIGAVLQQDVCILERYGNEHVLSGAVLCFPASWTLSQKIGKPLMAIHNPVVEYDGAIAKRVQRLFDGVQEGHPMWRANLLRYNKAELHQPKQENDLRCVGEPDAPYLRSERQTVLRLPQPDAVAFIIHTTVVAANEQCAAN